MTKIYVLKNRNMFAHGYALADGLRRHGFDVEIADKGFVPPPDSHFVVCWGWREGKRLRDLGFNVLVMECGYIGDRLNTWVSLGWNGLNGRATWNAPADNGERFETHHGHMLKPWKTDRDGYALIMGQVRGDAALQNVVINRWYYAALEAMTARGFQVKFRAHPVAVRRGLHVDQRVLPTRRLTGSLDEALAGASCVVTWNSNSGVDAALAGVPVIVCDDGAMAGPVAAHGLDADLVTPDRTDWCRRMSWHQWTQDELRSGYAWEHVRAVLPSLVWPEPDLGATGRTALVVGGGAQVRDDIKTALEMFAPDVVIAVNDIGAEWAGKLDHWVSNHPEKMPGWIEARASRGLGPAGRIWTSAHKTAAPEAYQRVVNPGGGSSAVAVSVARELGAERIVLAGVPLTSTPHFFDDVPWKKSEVAHYQRAWLRNKKHWLPYVRSVSGGFTEQEYGRATREWIEGADEQQNAA